MYSRNFMCIHDMPISPRTSRRAGRLAVWVVAGVLGWAALAPPASAQSRSTSALRGEVLLPGGTPAPQVFVQLENPSTGLSRTALTNASGRFLFLGLPPGGPYDLELTLLGYAKVRIEALNLAVGETRPLRITLSTEALELEGIDVTLERTSLFDPGRVGPVTLVPAGEIANLPLPTRDLTQLALLSPLVTRTESGGFSVAGQNERYNAILIDGRTARDPFGLTPGGLPGGAAGGKLIPLDAVAQYEVLVAPYDVRLSGFTGGVMNAVTRSGTNRLEATAFAAHRPSAVGGELLLETGASSGADISTTQAGFSLGGPIVKDRAHYFMALEFEALSRPPQGFILGRDDPQLIRLGEPEVEVAREAIRSFLGEDPGTAGVLSLDRSLLNLFAKVDVALGEGHRLTVRNVLARAEDDGAPNRLGFDPYGLSTNGAERTGLSNTVNAELISALGGRTTNELSVLMQVGSDESRANVPWPQIEVPVLSSIAGAASVRELRAGGALTSQDNDLEQLQLRVTDHLTFVRGSTTYTFGATAARYDFSQRYLPGGVGEFLFADVTALQNGSPSQLQWTSVAPGRSERVDFGVSEVGVMAQSELSAGKGLTMRFGLRADVPWIDADARRNWPVLNFFGWDTGALPGGNLLLSPRWSFNWQSDDGAGSTQVRAGAGLFNGQIPFVWMADALQNDGARTVVNRCGQGNIPGWDGAPPESCRFSPPEETRNVTVFSPDFRYPQDFRISLGMDQQVGDATLSFGVLYNRAFNQLVLSELNLGTPSRTGPVREYGGADRTYHGEPVPTGFLPVRADERFGQVLFASNASDDWAMAATAEAQGRIRGLDVRAGYTWSASRDRMSLVATDMISNFGFTGVETEPNAQPVRRSNFDRPHKVVASISGAPLGEVGPRISLLYIGQSGAPFSYVYGGDVNGDGYPGLGPAFERTNDLFFVPEPQSLLLMGFASQGLLAEATEQFECLRGRAGQFVERNGCRAPWQNSLDLRFSQLLPSGLGRLRLDLDFVNVLNLVNPEWGRIETVRPVVPLLDFVERSEAGSVLDPGQGGRMVNRWSGASFRDAEGRLQPTQPWTSVPNRSQWQVQLGVRMELGR